MRQFGSPRNFSSTCTERETEVLYWLRYGLQNKEIASKLGISPYTVRDHVSRMLLRYKVPNRAALACVYVESLQSIGQSADHAVPPLAQLMQPDNG